MNLEKKIFIVPIIFNLVVISFLYVDFLLPNNNVEKETFSTFYNVVNHYPKYRGSGGDEVIYILECKSGKTYHIPEFPNSFEELSSGQKIEIEKTFFLGKIKQVNFVEINEQFNISFLSENLIIIGFIISMLVSLLSLFFEIKYLEIFLAVSFVFVFFTIAIYLFYF